MSKHYDISGGATAPIRVRKSELLANTPLFINRVTVETVYSPEDSLSQLHIHNFVEVSIVTAGRGIHRTPDGCAECGAGDTYVIGAGVPHAYFAAEDGERPTVCNLVFDPAELFEGEAADPDSPRYCYGLFREDPLTVYVMLTSRTLEDVERTVTRMEKELSRRRPEWEMAVKSYLINILIMMGRYASQRENSPTAPRPKERLVAMEVMRAVMERYGDSGLTLESIAASLYISKSYLCRIFRRVTGESFGDYLRRVRLEQACRLLRETELTAEQIVYACGMRDVPTFYRQFKSHVGMTPNTYRQEKAPAEEAPSIEDFIMKIKGETNMSMTILNEISENLQKGKAKIVAELVQKALDEGVAPDAILNEGLLAGMNIIGEKFKTNEVYVPEVLVAARAMNKGTVILKPHLAAAGVQATGKVCIGTVQGDLHDIGKNLVKMMLEGKGLEVVDLGTDVSPETFVQTAIEQNCQVICCSALLTTTMGVMEDVVKKAVELGVRDKVKIMIGGAPVNEDYCKKIGADIYTPDAASAADAAVEFCKG
ncbi:MAG: helix-turn-helix domain-containing protein [Clostridia bacterium]|nr:helix-turn-helix domain-containing protein [Clostridia bacterium]